MLGQCLNVLLYEELNNRLMQATSVMSPIWHAIGWDCGSIFSDSSVEVTGAFACFVISLFFTRFMEKSQLDCPVEFTCSRAVEAAVHYSAIYFFCPSVGYLYYIKRLNVSFSQCARSCAWMLIALDLHLESHLIRQGKDINYTYFSCRL